MAERSAERAPLRAVLGTLIFTLVVPGTVIVYAPFALSRWRLSPPFLRIEAMRWAGAAIFVAALPIFVGFLTRFVREGRGTPAPIAPTERLVTGGTFKWIRNPGYVSVIGLLLGQTLFLGSRTLMLYTILVGIGFHLFVIGYEEPTLRRTFGAEYEAYCREVPRWIPRLRRHTS